MALSDDGHGHAPSHHRARRASTRRPPAYNRGPSRRVRSATETRESDEARCHCARLVLARRPVGDRIRCLGETATATSPAAGSRAGELATRFPLSAQVPPPAPPPRTPSTRWRTRRGPAARRAHPSRRGGPSPRAHPRPREVHLHRAQLLDHAEETKTPSLSRRSSPFSQCDRRRSAPIVRPKVRSSTTRSSSGLMGARGERRPCRARPRLHLGLRRGQRRERADSRW